MERYKPGAPDLPDMLGSFKCHGLFLDKAPTGTLLAVLAGTDTTAGEIKVALFWLLNTPSPYRRLVEEIDEAMASGKISLLSSTLRPVSFLICRPSSRKVCESYCQWPVPSINESLMGVTLLLGNTCQAVHGSACPCTGWDARGNSGAPTQTFSGRNDG